MRSGIFPILVCATLGLAGGILSGAMSRSPNGQAGAGVSVAGGRTDTRGAVERSVNSETGSGEKSGATIFRGASEGEVLVQIPPERVVSLFDRLSNVKSESRKYALAYRLAAKLDVTQLEAAFHSAKADLDGGDYVALRALGRRWVELDPQAAAQKGIDTRMREFLHPVLEAWQRLDSEAPLKWALADENAPKLDAVRSLLFGGYISNQQTEQLAIKAQNSQSAEMRYQIFPHAVMQIAAFNPERAISLASAVEDPGTRQRTLNLVISRYAQSSPEKARAWVDAQPTLTPDQRGSYERLIDRSVQRGQRGSAN